jgi:predicted nucleic acid-binding protein
MTTGADAFSAIADTNVLVYAVDRTEPAKQALAIDVLKRLGTKRRLVLTSQVLGEFYRVSTRRIPAPLDPVTAAVRVERLAEHTRVLAVDARVVLKAVQLATMRGMSYWDAQLVATAKVHGVSLVLSEDFPHRSEVEGVRFLDPFALDFDADDLSA